MTLHVPLSKTSRNAVSGMGAMRAVASAPESVAVTTLVRLIDRRTGRPHTVGGAPLSIFTKVPAEAARLLMRGRDPANWEVRIEPLATAGPRR